MRCVWNWVSPVLLAVLPEKGVANKILKSRHFKIEIMNLDKRKKQRTMAYLVVEEEALETSPRAC